MARESAELHKSSGSGVMAREF
jgi:hypothetical protein